MSFLLQLLFRVFGWHCEKQLTPMSVWYLRQRLHHTLQESNSEDFFKKTSMLPLSWARVRWLQLDFWIEKPARSDLGHGLLIFKCVGDCYKMRDPYLTGISCGLLWTRDWPLVCPLEPNTQVSGWRWGEALDCQQILQVAAGLVFSQRRYWVGLTGKKEGPCNTSNTTTIRKFVWVY